MRRIRNKAELYISKAEDLSSRMRSVGMLDGCLAVAICALGGDIHFYNVISNENISSIHSVREAGLGVGGFVYIKDKISGADLADTLEMLFVERREGEERGLSGFLVLRFFPKEIEYLNHFFTIIPKQLMSSRTESKLEKQNKYMVVGSEGSKSVGKIHPNEFSEYINGNLELGANFQIFQIFK